MAPARPTIRDLREARQIAQGLGTAPVTGTLAQSLRWLAEAAPLGAVGRKALGRLASEGYCQTVGQLLASDIVSAWLERELPASELGVLGRFLAERLEADRVGAGAPEPDALRLDMTRAELFAWARPRGVAGWLDVPVATLARYLPPDTPTRPGAVLADILSPPRAGWHADPWPPAVRSAALALLSRFGAGAEVAYAEETVALGARRPPDDPAAADVWGRLTALRAELRERSAPRTRAQRELAAVHMDEDGGGLSYSEPVVPLCGGARDRATSTVLPGLPGGAAAVRCDCPRPRRGGCAHGLAAVDWVLDRLDATAPAGGRDARAIASFLDQGTRAPWQRTLDALAQALRADTGGLPFEAAEEALGWEIEPGANPRVRAVAVRAKRRGEGYVRRRLDEGAVARAAAALDGDDRLLAELAPLVAPRGAPPAPGPAAAVFRALSRHPRAFLAGQDAPVSVRCATLGLTFDATPAGVRVTAHAGSFSFGVLDALDLVGDALVHVVPEAEGAGALAIVVPRALRDALDELIAPVRGLLPPEAADAVRALAPSLARVVPVALGASIGGRALEVARGCACASTSRAAR
ncbi:MAG: hypothetical protein H6745_14105 [Deltaproteobacteria bacterium]|nr:hypothetical protein [Deltaproteobacteria bacterium]